MSQKDLLVFLIQKKTSNIFDFNYDNNKLIRYSYLYYIVGSY